MEIIKYESLPGGARAVRQAVFVEEQGFLEEFDETDASAVHLVMFQEDGDPIAVCRVFWDGTMDGYVLGRLAVLKEHRSEGLGSAMVRAAEDYVRGAGGNALALHAQCSAAGFYEKLGFSSFGRVEDVEGCPHIWMRRPL